MAHGAVLVKKSTLFWAPPDDDLWWDILVQIDGSWWYFDFEFDEVICITRGDTEEGLMDWEDFDVRMSTWAERSNFAGSNVQYRVQVSSDPEGLALYFTIMEDPARWLMEQML